MAFMRRTRTIMDGEITDHGEPCAEIAFFVDEDAYNTPALPATARKNAKLLRHEIGLMGAPCAYYLSSDFEAVRDRYRAYIHLTPTPTVHSAAIDSYAEVHAHEYNRRIQYCVVRYILILMTNDQVNLYEDHSLVNRIKCLNKDELVELLTDELKRDMVPVYWKDANGQYQRGLDLLSKAQTVDDNNLDRIERHHWRTHPNEGAAYFRRAKKWWDWDLTLW